jgi:hypothetical protein
MIHGTPFEVLKMGLDFEAGEDCLAQRMLSVKMTGVSHAFVRINWRP